MKVFLKKWQDEHPDWNVIEEGELRTNFDLIEVPQITIGHHTVEPVWIVSRPDENFLDWMSQWMDSEIQGALGGSAFQHFDSILVDYKAEYAIYF